ncbi:MAG TPA: peptidylprolyl isomerase [Solimonas sp.]|nr:peptidylprolyl isomerase [Solimonas sp.]
MQQPLLHFLLLGALLFALQDHLRPREAIHLRAADVERLREEWRSDTGRAPTPAQLQASLDHWLADEALLREALRLGLDQRDVVAQRRLLMNLRFAFPETPLDDAALLREAEALEMQGSDLVMRRRLIQAMEQRLLGELRLSERELRDYVAAHPGRYAAPPRYHFRQVYLAAGRAPEEATRMLAQLRAAPPAATLPGDAFQLGERFDGLTAAEIARGFGADFAQALQQLPPGQWSGPLASPYGAHLLWLEQIEPGAPADFAALRQQAAYALLAEREAQFLAQARSRLRQRYRVQAESGVPPGLVS